ncbi:hypothetical protein PHLGIDRAFT_19570 [Phlebiopsis gigantea 11061_1 CR5-6]|uniref:Uncharacterized protein n=1 Tax=Phlebiopsis gigantea (strain 11061_1 CR5-6) TaxID=745531 RepID=A0A0C3PIT0_PHLG1|nr:hypothetical protein PHLGIDRAFT_19570 [Phlebiopsis gigantea 11061_1 CR5-6]
MTEYDYSPEAYEKYVENQSRVSNWVSDQSGRYNQYSNPFTGRTTSVPPPSHSSHHSSRRTDRSHHSSSTTSPVRARSSRPEPHRSFTAPVQSDYRSSSQGSRSHHGSTSPTSYVSNGTYVSYNHDPYKPKARQQDFYIDTSSKQIVLPRPRHGEQYMIYPPNGREVLVVNNDPYTYVHTSSGSPVRTVSPKKEAPLLKRLFTGFSASSKNTSRHSSSPSSRRDRSRSH